MVALIGASGSGKSTLIRALAALTPIDRGPKHGDPENADRIVVMNAGRIEQTGTPAEVCEEPATPFVWEFLRGRAIA